MQKELLSLQEARELIGVSRTTIYQMAKQGQIPTLKIGKCIKVPRKKLDEWIEEKTLLAKRGDAV